jgi:hypothetical protein
MLQANLYDARIDDDFDLGGDLGWWNPVDTAKDVGGFIKDKTVAAAEATYSGVKTAGQWTVDKVCSSTMDPKVQAAAAGAALVPSGYSQAAGGAVMATGAACAAFYPADMPQPQPTPAESYVTPLKMSITPVSDFYKSRMPPKTSSAPVPSAVPSPAVAPGTIAAFDPKRGAYRVAVPGLPGFSAPAAFTEVGTQASPPPGAQLVDLKTFVAQTGGDTRPWFKNPLVLGGIAAGALVLGGGAYMLTRG